MLAGFVTLAARPAPAPVAVDHRGQLADLRRHRVLYPGAGAACSANRKPRWAFTAALALALPAIAAMVPWPLALRTSAMSALYVLMILPAIGLILRRRACGPSPRCRTVAAMLALAVGALVVRAVDSWMHPSSTPDLMQASLGQGWPSWAPSWPSSAPGSALCYGVQARGQPVGGTGHSRWPHRLPEPQHHRRHAAARTQRNRTPWHAAGLRADGPRSLQVGERSAAIGWAMRCCGGFAHRPRPAARL